MLVYRVCSKDEIDIINREKNFDNVGKKYKSNILLNNFKYDTKLRYLHFFENYSDILYHNTLKGKYMCIYDIPEDVLYNYSGIGFYLDYINFRNIVKVNEFAIPVKILFYKYLVDYYELKDDLDYEDFLDCNKKMVKMKNIND